MAVCAKVETDNLISVFHQSAIYRHIPLLPVLDKLTSSTDIQ